MPKLTRDFYTGTEVALISRNLLGKYLFTKIGGVITAGIITETEAYAGVSDRASHAYGNRRTARTKVMYQKGGTAYVYLCYGVHHLFNVVTNKKNIPHAVLVRAIKPTEGTEHIAKRRNAGKMSLDRICEITKGPGTLTQALGIKTCHSGADLCGNVIWIEDRGIIPRTADISIHTRIGIAYAGEDALLPYRFHLNI